MSTRWKSLWPGPAIGDRRPRKEKGTNEHGPFEYAHENTWVSTGLYALDMEDQAWTLAAQVSYLAPSVFRWIRLDEFIRGGQ